MKKLLAALLPAAMAVSMCIPALAAVKAGSQEYPIFNITGNPITEKGVQFNPNTTAAPGQTVYFALPDTLSEWVAGKNVWPRLRLTANEKLVKSIELVDKRIKDTGTFYIPDRKDPGDDGYDAYSLGDKHTFIALTLNNMSSTEEIKVEFEAEFTARGPIKLYYGKERGPKDVITETVRYPFTNTYQRVSRSTQYFDGKEGDRLTLHGYLFVGNAYKEGTYAEVNENGLAFKPTRDANCELVYTEDGRRLAIVEFPSGTRPQKFYTRLDTRWREELIRPFEGTDAVVREFDPAVNLPERGTLSLENPFDKNKVNPSNVHIYSYDEKGRITDITAQFSYDSANDFFTCSTRTLDGYILSSKKVDISDKTLPKI